MSRSDHEDALLDLVKDSAQDIAFDYANGYRGPVTVEEVTSGTDDGTAYGTYTIRAGQFIITVTSQAIFEGFQDCWNSSSESHYTRQVYFEELEDFTFDVEDVQKELEEPKEINLDK